jgi:transposase
LNDQQASSAGNFTRCFNNEDGHVRNSVIDHPARLTRHLLRAPSRELKRPGVNLLMLWDEYRAVHPEGYAYSRFCQLFREFEQRLSPTMRQQHIAGDKAFVDYSGKRVPIANPATGEVHLAEIFVAVLGASNLTYAEATWMQTLPDWIGAHVRMFRFTVRLHVFWRRTISRLASTRRRSTTLR